MQGFVPLLFLSLKRLPPYPLVLRSKAKRSTQTGDTFWQWTGLGWGVVAILHPTRVSLRISLPAPTFKMEVKFSDSAVQSREVTRL